MTLKELRLNAKLRQEDVARCVEVDQASVSNWENGKNPPSGKYQKKLARLYGVSVDELLADTEQKKHEKIETLNEA